MENNELFAEFLEWEKNEDGTFESPSKFFWEDKHAHMSWNVVRYDWKPSDMLFDIEWNWLMEVVEKIESLGYRTLTENECFMITKSKLIPFDVRSKDDYSTIFSDNYEINHYGGSKKENVYNACLEFVKWYKENKSK